MTTEAPADDARDAARFEGPSGAEKRAVDLGVRLCVWGFGVLTARLALTNPILTAPIAPSATLGYEEIDRWYAVGGAALLMGTLLAVALLTLAAARLVSVAPPRAAAGVALGALGLELLGRVLDLVGLLPELGTVQRILEGAELLGLLALLVAVRGALAALGRRAPLGAAIWATVALLGAAVLGTLSRGPTLDYPSFAALAAAGWLAGTLGMFMAGVFAARAHHAVVRLGSGLAASADLPPQADADWRAARGWAAVTDGLRLVASGLFVRLLAAGLVVVILLVTRIQYLELIIRLLLLTSPVLAGLSALAMLAGAHGLATGPSPRPVRLLAWAAAGLLMLTLVIYALAYMTVLRSFEQPLMALALADRLLLYDLLTPLVGYLALWSLLSASVRLAHGFGLTRLARRARSFRYLLVATVLVTLAYGGAAAHHLDFELVLMFGVLTVFLAAWLLLGCSAMLRRMADAIEAELAAAG